MSQLLLKRLNGKLLERHTSNVVKMTIFFNKKHHVIDGFDGFNIYLEEIILSDQVIYLEKYTSISILHFLRIIIKEIFAAWKKEKEFS